MRYFIKKSIYILLILFLLISCNTDDLFKYDVRDEYNKKSVSFYYSDSQMINFVNFMLDNNFSAANEMLSSGEVEIDTVGKEGMNPLFLCFVYANYEGFSKLLDWGADPNYVVENGPLLLNWSIKVEDSRYLESLLKNDADPNIKLKNHNHPLENAIIDGQYEKNFRTLLDYGSNPDYSMTIAMNPVISAIMSRRYYYSQILLEYGASIFEHDDLKEYFISKMETYTQAMFSDELKEQKALVKYLEENHGIKIKLKAPLGTL